jgi:hypothetical protein
MAEDTADVLEITNDKSPIAVSYGVAQPVPGFTKITFGICLYAALASVYYLIPNKRLLSFGQLRFTLDAFLECLFTVLSLPVFYLVHRYGMTTYEENMAFDVPELPIELLVLGSIILIALGNGIHLASKLAEQIVITTGGQSDVAGTKDIHFLRQVVGHVAPHIGWQLLFVGLMLGQFKWPHRGKPRWLSKHIPLWGMIFGLLFAQGTIAAGCMDLGITLTVISLAAFSYLAYASKLPGHEIPVQRFFMASQISFLLGMVVFWSVPHIPRLLAVRGHW